MRKLGGNRAGEARYSRFLLNPKIAEEKIVEQATLGTAKRVKGRHILAIQDTTSFGDDGSGNSLVGHSTIAVEAELGTPPGLVMRKSLSARAATSSLRGTVPFVTSRAIAGWKACSSVRRC